MMTVGFVKAKDGGYYIDGTRLDYYASGGESPGTYHLNEAAVELGLHGTVEKQDFERLLYGYHPKTGEPLAQNHGKDDRRGAIDICLSAPKDVSAAWAVAGDAERRLIEQAFERAVDQTLDG